jgi:hypothetical protein
MDPTDTDSQHSGTRLFRGRMIRLLSRHPPPPFPLSELDRRKINNLLTGEGGGVGQEPNHMTVRKPGSLEIIQYRTL